jgi:hypothetical protein
MSDSDQMEIFKIFFFHRFKLKDFFSSWIGENPQNQSLLFGFPESDCDIFQVTLPCGKDTTVMLKSK